jgi:hypothetical protein
VKHIVIAGVAALVLIAGVSVVNVVVSPAADAQEQEPASADEAPNDGEVRSGMLAGVLDRLVGDGTLSRQQADAVEEAIRAEVADRKPLRRAERRGAQRGYRLGRLLADDVIDAEELEMLREDHPLRDPDGIAAPYLDDGQLTVDELRLIRQAWKESRSAER